MSFFIRVKPTQNRSNLNFNYLRQELHPCRGELPSSKSPFASACNLPNVTPSSFTPEQYADGMSLLLFLMFTVLCSVIQFGCFLQRVMYMCDVCVVCCVCDCDCVTVSCICCCALCFGAWCSGAASA